jgi:hypothetical protein
MHCILCNKPLTDPESIERGMGSDCWEQLLHNVIQNTPNFIDRYCGVFDGNVTLKRGADAAPLTNIPHKALLHSKKGYEWGNLSAGSADLALNILWHFTSPAVAIRWHQEFKRDFLAKIPQEGGFIEGNLIKKWIQGKTQTLF